MRFSEIVRWSAVEILPRRHYSGARGCPFQHFFVPMAAACLYRQKRRLRYPFACRHVSRRILYLRPQHHNGLGRGWPAILTYVHYPGLRFHAAIDQGTAAYHPISPSIGRAGKVRSGATCDGYPLAGLGRSAPKAAITARLNAVPHAFSTRSVPEPRIPGTSGNDKAGQMISAICFGILACG